MRHATAGCNPRARRYRPERPRKWQTRALHDVVLHHRAGGSATDSNAARMANYATATEAANSATQASRNPMSTRPPLSERRNCTINSGITSSLTKPSSPPSRAVPRHVGPEHAERAEQEQQHRQAAGRRHQFAPHVGPGQRRDKREQPDHDQDAGGRGRPRQRHRHRNGQPVRPVGHPLVDRTPWPSGCRSSVSPAAMAGDAAALIADRPRRARMRSLAIMSASLRSLADNDGTVRFRMPQVQHAGREHAVLAAHAGMQQPHDDVGILLAPAA